MLKQSSKTIFLTIIFSLVSIVLTVLLQEPIKHIFYKYFSKAAISYDVISISSLKEQELQEYAKAEGINPFDLKLDDPIIDKYYVIKLKLNNKGIALTGSLKFLLSIGKTYVKIIDIKHIVKEPAHKAIAISHSIPDLTWSLEKASEGTLTWDPPITNIDGTKLTDLAGFNVYRSKFKDIGYGRFNDKLIQNTFFKIDSEILYSPNYYASEAVDLHGNRSELSSPVKFPEILAFSAHFKDVIFINPYSKSKKQSNGSKMNKCISLTEAIKREGKESTYLVNEYRKNIVSANNLINNSNEKIKVLYLDDLKFLEGQADIFFPSGLDEDAEIYFYFLIKNLPEAGYDLSLTLEGRPEVKVIRNNASIKKNIPKYNEKAKDKIDKKYSLTPLLATIYVGKNTIYLMWEYPMDQKYKGVRIFRSEKIKNHSYSRGAEIYNGMGNTDKLLCINKKGVVFQADSKVGTFDVPIEPPRKKESTFSLSPADPKIFNVTMSGEVNVKPGGRPLPFFADNKVSSKIVYTYTLYAYDDNGINSYPIVINASLRDLDIGIICETESK